MKYRPSSFLGHLGIHFMIISRCLFDYKKYVFCSKILAFYIVKYARKWPNLNCFEQSGLTTHKTFDTILMLGTKRHLKVTG